MKDNDLLKLIEKNTRRTAQNVAFFFWLFVAPILFIGLFYLLMLIMSII